MYEIGEPYKFVPASNQEKASGFGKELLQKKTGTIVYKNEAHRYFRVELVLPRITIYECFKY